MKQLLAIVLEGEDPIAVVTELLGKLLFRKAGAYYAGQRVYQSRGKLRRTASKLRKSRVARYAGGKAKDKASDEAKARAMAAAKARLRHAKSMRMKTRTGARPGGRMGREEYKKRYGRSRPAGT